jgi:flagellar hook-associated protein 1 FlgK
MSVGLSNALNTARVGMAANMTEIDVISHNIANANNPEYRRQVGYLETTSPIPSGIGPRGTGVQVSRIEALYDRFLFKQINHETANSGRWGALADGLDRVERLFNDLDGNGLSSQMADFWGAWEDLANQPDGVVERSALIGKSQTLTGSLNAMSSDLDFQRQVLNDYFRSGIDKINQISDSLRDLNQEVLGAEINGGTANDLRDKRLGLVSQLSELVDIDYNEDESGQLNIMLKNGKPLVLGSEVFHLEARADENGDYHAYFGSEGIALDDDFGSGKLKGWIDARQQLNETRDDLNRLTSTLIYRVNQYHFQGYDLERETGRTFFDHQIELQEGMDNQGDATISFNHDSTNAAAPDGVAWATLATCDDYEIRFTADYNVDGSNTPDFKIINTTTGKELDASHYVVAESSNQMIISFNENDGSSRTEGYRLQLDFNDDPKAGDSFTLSFGNLAAKTVKLNSDLENPDHIAASDDYFEVPGNNKVALQIAALQNRATVNDSHTFNDFYTSMASQTGSVVQTAKARSSQSNLALEQLEDRQDSFSGVSIDEEMTNLIKYQQSYQATARMVTTVNELMQILNDML